MEKKKTLGRQKIKMELITKVNARRIAYSRRRRGLFKKANELSTLCGVDVAIVTFSLGGKAFCFGRPSVESVIDQFLNQNPQLNNQSLELDTSEQDDRLHELDQQLYDLQNQLEAEKEKGKKLREMSKEGTTYQSLEEHINKLGLHELEQLKMSMEELKQDMIKQANKLMMEPSSSSPLIEDNHVQEVDELVDGKTNIDISTIPHDWLKL
ncbi:hypothetical protein L1049_010213 [Liquidambar formosana]|uniref:MADS-box domain-containing protein n=1 Tax=Liquidambar formosana TaxID=63359 RepID=A0AAP0R4P1_LIQFO